MILLWCSENAFVNKSTYSKAYLIRRIRGLTQEPVSPSIIEFDVGLQKITGYEISRTGVHEMDGKISPG